jgi:hypothetical protein
LQVTGDTATSSTIADVSGGPGRDQHFLVYLAQPTQLLLTTCAGSWGAAATTNTGATAINATVRLSLFFLCVSNTKDCIYVCVILRGTSSALSVLDTVVLLKQKNVPKSTKYCHRLIPAASSVVKGLECLIDMVAWSSARVSQQKKTYISPFESYKPRI